MMFKLYDISNNIERVNYDNLSKKEKKLDICLEFLKSELEDKN